MAKMDPLPNVTLFTDLGSTVRRYSIRSLNFNHQHQLFRRRRNAPTSPAKTMVTWGPSTTTTFGTSTPASSTPAAAPSAFSFGGAAPSTPPLTPQTPAANPPPLTTGFSFGGAAPAPSAGLFGGEWYPSSVGVLWCIRGYTPLTHAFDCNLTNFYLQHRHQLHQEVSLDPHQLHLPHQGVCLVPIQVCSMVVLILLEVRLVA